MSKQPTISELGNFTSLELVLEVTSATLVNFSTSARSLLMTPPANEPSESASLVSPPWLNLHWSLHVHLLRNQCRQTEELEDGVEGSLGALGVTLHRTISSSKLVILVKAALSNSCISFSCDVTSFCTACLTSSAIVHPLILGGMAGHLMLIDLAAKPVETCWWVQTSARQQSLCNLKQF